MRVKNTGGFFMFFLRSMTVMLCLVFLIDCGRGAPRVEPRSGRTDTDYNDRIRNDRERAGVLEDSRHRYSGKTCQEEREALENTSEDHVCRDQCYEIYGRRDDREDCEEELPVDQIAVLFDIYKVLKNPNKQELRELEEYKFDLEVYFRLSISGFDQLIDDEYNKGDAKAILNWLSETPSVANFVIAKEEDDFTTLEELLKLLVSFNTNANSIYTPFLERVDGTNRLIEVAIASRNTVVLNWFQSYIREEASTCKGEDISRACFEIFCKIGNKIDDRSSENWLRDRTFQAYIMQIIEDRINATRWQPSSSDIKRLDHISDGWVQALCGGLT